MLSLVQAQQALKHELQVYKLVQLQLPVLAHLQLMLQHLLRLHQR